MADDVGGAGPSPNDDGTIVDKRDANSTSIDVGAGSSNTTFAPPAVAVSTGTTVTWEWTGDGGAHNVQAQPAQQIQASDYTFSSGEPTDDSSMTFEQTFDQSGIAL